MTTSEKERRLARGRDDGSLILCVGGRGAAVVRVRRGPHGVAVKTLGARRAVAGGGAGPAAEALAGAVADAGLRGETAPLVVGEVVSRTQLVGTPPLKGAELRRAIENQFGPDETIIDSEAGSLYEGVRVLGARFAVAASRDDLRRLVAAVEGHAIAAEAVWSLDRVLMEFARDRLGPCDGGMRVAAVVEPTWIHLVCVADGRALFVRRVETPEDLGAAERAGVVTTEIHKTALVVRGKLRPPPLEASVLFDPLGLVPDDALRDASDAAGLATTRASYAISIEAASGPASLGDVVRAAVADEVRLARRDGRCRFECSTRSSRRSEAARRAAAAALVLACWGAAATARVHLEAEADRLRASAGAAVSDDVATDALREATKRDAARIAAFRRDHAELLRYVGSAVPLGPVLRSLAAATPCDVALTTIVAAPPKSGGRGRAVRIDGFVDGGVARTCDALRALRTACESSPGFAGAVPADVVGDPFADHDGREPETTSFRWTSHWTRPLP